MKIEVLKLAEGKKVRLKTRGGKTYIGILKIQNDTVFIQNNQLVMIAPSDVISVQVLELEGVQ